MCTSQLPSLQIQSTNLAYLIVQGNLKKKKKGMNIQSIDNPIAKLKFLKECSSGAVFHTGIYNEWGHCV